MHDSLTARISREWAPPDGKQELNQYLKEGVKLNKFCDGKNPVEQILLRNSTFNSAQAYSQNFGDRVFFQSFYSETGEPIIAPIAAGPDGEIALPDETGKFRYINGTWIDREYEVYMAIQKRIDQQMKWCVISDEIARQIMGFTKEKWDEVAGPKGLPGMDPEMAKLNCHIAYIKSLPSDSVLQTQSLSKLRAICGQRLANIHRTGMGKEKDSDDNTEKVQVKKPDGYNAGSGAPVSGAQPTAPTSNAQPASSGAQGSGAQGSG